jgi:hypothetical protein
MVAKYLQFVSSAAVVFFPGFSGFLVLLSLLFEACCCCLCCFVAGLCVLLPVCVGFYLCLL